MSIIRLNKAAYIHNLTKILDKVGDKNRVILILKDNAYGHGAAIISDVASELGFGFCAVKNEIEASEMVDKFSKILILSHIVNGDENSKYIYAINDMDAIKNIKSGTKIHLAIDTLMHRNGIGVDEILTALNLVKKRSLILDGAFTHFRSASELNADYFVQKQNFANAKILIKKWADENGLKTPMFHSHNSAGFERVHKLHDESVRVGMVQFGYTQFDENFDLKPVLSLYAHRLSKRLLRAGQSVGYGAKYTATNDINIATYDLGYADGLFRYDGYKELRLANQNKILGTMSMDSFSTLDVGDEVCVFDDARVWAKYFNTIEYEILVKLSKDIRRVWV
ncbi:alanine racemase [Campylobacter majalis]|uniref:alanine racemase n=1 Tax=Campylobacter majalis TaxID=2790656 RepID=UPI003D69F19E